MNSENNINNTSFINNININIPKIKPVTSHLTNLNAKVARVVQCGKIIVFSGTIGAGIGFIATVGAAGGLVIGLFGGVSTGILYYVIKRNRQIQKEQEEIKTTITENNKFIHERCENLNEISNNLDKTTNELKKNISEAGVSVQEAQENIEEATSDATNINDLLEESFDIAKNLEDMFISIQDENVIKEDTKPSSKDKKFSEDFNSILLKTFMTATTGKEFKSTNELDTLLDGALEDYTSKVKATSPSIVKVSNDFFNKTLESLENSKKNAMMVGIKKTDLDQAVKEIEVLMNNLNNAKKTINDLQEKLKTAEKNLNTAKNSLNLSNDYINEMEKEIASLKENIQLLTEKNNENESEIQKLQSYGESTENMVYSFVAGASLAVCIL